MTETVPAAGATQPQFAIEKLYIKDLSLEVPNAPGIFMEQGQPAVDLNLHTNGTHVRDDAYHVTLSVTVTAKMGDKTLFLIEVVQGGIFRISGVLPDMLPQVLGITCPNLLYPYAREVVSDVSVRAGFMPIVLQPINFEMLYQQQAAQAPAGAAPDGADGQTH
jgi:preprotein translocase subunit SecB